MTAIQAWACLLLLASEAPTEKPHFEKSDGPARLRVWADRVENGRLVLRLSSALRVEVSIEGGADLEVNEIKEIKQLTATPGWALKLPAEWTVDPLPNGRQRWRQTIRLDPRMNPAKTTLAWKPFPYRSGGADRVARWPALELTVFTSADPPDLKSMRDITGIEPSPQQTPWWHYLLWAMAGVLVAAGLVVGGRELRRRWTRPMPLPPAEWALRELNLLDAATAPPGSPPDWYHTRLSNIVRRYLEERFDLKAQRQTTAEFLASIREGSPLSSEHQQLLRDLLEGCDRIKFTGVPPSDADRTEAAALACRFVQQTIPPPKGP